MPSYTSRVALEVNTFYTIYLEEARGLFGTKHESPAYLLPTRNIDPGTEIQFNEIIGSRMQNLPIQVFKSVNEEGEDTEIAYLITSRFPVDNFHTGLVQIFNSWHRNVENPSIGKDELYMALKLPGMFIYAALNKVTLVTIPDLHEKLEDLLLAI